MKQTEMIVLGLAGVAVYLIWQSQKKKASGTAASPTRGTVDTFVDEIFNFNGKAFENGWRYFENGVAIDPEGNYYQNGQRVYTAPGRYI